LCRKLADQSNTNLLALPHRIADFRVRASNQKDAAEKAIKALASGDALPLLRFMPTSIIFGFWDKALCGNRALLIEVAKAAHEILEIPLTPGSAVFESTAASLKGELEQGGKGKKGKGTARKPKKNASETTATEESPVAGEETKTESGRSLFAQACGTSACRRTLWNHAKST